MGSLPNFDSFSGENKLPSHRSKNFEVRILGPKRTKGIIDTTTKGGKGEYSNAIIRLTRQWETGALSLQKQRRLLEGGGGGTQRWLG